MPHKATVLLIEGDQVRQQYKFETALRQYCDVLFASNGRRGVDLVSKHAVDVMILNAASLRVSGLRICQSLKKKCKAPLILIQAQEKTDKTRIVARYADVTLHLPFTPRKLINRIEGFVPSIVKQTHLYAEPFVLELETCLLKTPNGEVRLSPKLMGLMVLFMRHPNVVLERQYLMEQVWQTQYMGDTRTLDVHIRWIREAIEQNPSKPQYLRTVRGRGYIFITT
ncbi:MAG: hypothetical protein CUN55_14715 [Phototrophicales bacterium]|nr:MAG: hypothetical protein CUN55_14715 [Phototrophicales bacterium]